MAPNSAVIAGLLRQAIHFHLDNFSYENALFFAERLQAHDPRSPESAYLLALCYLQHGDPRSAYEASKPSGSRGLHLGCAFIFAQSCLELERNKEGIVALEKARGSWPAKSTIGKHSASTRMPYPDASTISCLLGKLYRAYDDKKKAIPCFEDALRSNPFMWDAFTNLCDMGANVRVPNIFKMNDSFARSFDQEPSSPTLDTSGGPTAPEPLQKRSTVQSLNQDSDPFETNRPAAHQDLTSNNIFTESGENDLMSRMVAPQARYQTAQTSKHGVDGMETPTAPAGSAPEAPMPRSVYPSEPPQAPSRRTRGAQSVDPGLLDAPPRMSYRLGSKKREKTQEQVSDISDTTTTRGTTLSLSATERKRTASGHPVQPRSTNGEEPRRSARLNVFPRTTTSKANSAATAVGTTATRELKKARPPISRIMRPGSSGSSVGRVVSGNRKPLEENSMDIDHAEAPRVREQPVPQPPPPKPVELESVKNDEALKWILELLKKMANGYLSASQFQCQEALNIYTALPRSHQDTPWVLAQMGRAQYELANYAEAEKFFRRLRIVAPTRLEDMEFYSTVLWQLRRETDLSFLAHELVDAVWDSPEAWCALGNAWSLACDHEQALRCFKRATQLDPKFAYAYTLQGHEHVEIEEYDKALVSYRHAISSDKRHYNAYYGIGRVYERLGNYEKAFSHYHAASVIHPTHAVLICAMGSCLVRQKQVSQGLAFFDKAVVLAPRAPDVRLRRARALLALGDMHAARDELMVLKDLAPDRAQVHFLLGKVAKVLRDKKAAVKHFTSALSLDPKVRYSLCALNSAC